MIAALIGFGLGWFARALWERRRGGAQELTGEPTRAEPEIPPAAAFAQGPVARAGEGN
ncbi:MAG: hypothetical protein U0R69_06275 [Gaiellales bacterium]